MELKLASAKSAAHRIKVRADVLELIHLLNFGPDFADQLDSYVREEFKTLAALPPHTNKIESLPRQLQCTFPRDVLKNLVPCQ